MTERKRFLLRISPELFEELNRWAAQDFRSVNGQIEFLLEQAVRERRRRPPPKGPPDPAPQVPGSGEVGRRSDEADR